MIMIKIKIFPSWRMVPNCFVKSNTEHCFKLNDKVMLQVGKSEDFYMILSCFCAFLRRERMREQPMSKCRNMRGSTECIPLCV